MGDEDVADLFRTPAEGTDRLVDKSHGPGKTGIDQREAVREHDEKDAACPGADPVDVFRYLLHHLVVHQSVPTQFSTVKPG